MGLTVWTPKGFEFEQGKIRDLVSGKYPKIVNLVSPLDFEWSYLHLSIFIEAWASHKFELFRPPGLESLSSKSLLEFVDQFVKLYLKESPILKSVETHWLQTAADVENLDARSVVKKTDGSQGKEVYVLGALTSGVRQNVKKMVRNWIAWSDMKEAKLLPWWVEQKFVEASFLPPDLHPSWIKFNVDVRPHVFVSAGVPSLPALWGRTNFKMPGYFNNVSQQAFELVVTTPKQCERALFGQSGIK